MIRLFNKHSRFAILETVLILVLVLFSFLCMAQRPPQGPMSTEIFSAEKLGYQLVWEDEFEGTTLDSTKWKVRGIGPRAIAYVSEQAVEVADGFLNLYALKQGDSLLGSAVGTGDLFMPRYGYFECRAQGAAAEIARCLGGILAAIEVDCQRRRSSCLWSRD